MYVYDYIHIIINVVSTYIDLSDGMDMRFRSNRHIMLTRSKAIKMKDHSYKSEDYKIAS